MLHDPLIIVWLECKANEINVTIHRILRNNMLNNRPWEKWHPSLLAEFLDDNLWFLNSQK